MNLDKDQKRKIEQELCDLYFNAERKKHDCLEYKFNIISEFKSLSYDGVIDYFLDIEILNLFNAARKLITNSDKPYTSDMINFMHVKCVDEVFEMNKDTILEMYHDKDRFMEVKLKKVLAAMDFDE